MLELVTSGLPTVAVRVPRHRLMQSVLEFADRPIAAPSANRFGRISPTRAEHVIDQLGSAIDYVLDGGKCRVGVESTILQVDTDNRVTLLRPGGLTQERIEAIVGPVRRTSSFSRGATPPRARHAAAALCTPHANSIRQAPGGVASARRIEMGRAGVPVGALPRLFAL